MSKSTDFEWTKDEMASIMAIADWYARVLDQRGHERPDHPLRALLSVGRETFLSNQRFDEIAKAGEQTQLDPDTVANLTAEPATADELAAICGVLASTLSTNSGIVNEADLRHHRATMVAQVLAQVRLRNQTEHMVGNRLQ